MSTQYANTNQKDLTPIVINLGKTRKKKIRRLKRGTGPLLDEVQQAVAMTRSREGGNIADKVCVPIVLIYEKKRKRTRRWGF